MGKQDLVSREYFQDSYRLADLLNAEVFQGVECIGPEDIQQRDPFGVRETVSEAAVHAAVVTRDLMGELHIGLQVILLALEFQNNVHYAMPLRVLNSDSIGYDTQWRKKRAAHRQEKDLRGDEYLSGFGKYDRLVPVFTIVLYFGREPWDGPRTLKDMLDLSHCPPEFAQRIADYPLYLIEVREYPHIERFRSDLRYVFGFLQRDREKEALYQYVTENRAVFSHLDGTAYQMIQVMSHFSGLLKEKEEYENEEGEIDMCQALLDMREECISIGKEKGREEGISIGREEGISIGKEKGILIGKKEGISIGKQLTKQVFRLWIDGKTEKEIAEACEIPMEEVKEILA